MADALGRCHVFIALWSPRYFLNEMCGRQYWVFNERLRRQQTGSGGRPRSLLPLMWTPTNALAGASPLFVRPDDGVALRGLRRYVRLRGLREPYEAFVGRLAEQVVTAAQASALPQNIPVPALLETPSAFTVADLRPVSDAGPAGASGDPTAVEARASGSQQVCFVVAAGSRDEMRRVREDLSAYGEASRDWAPYRPALAAPLADHAQALAAEHLINSEFAEVEEVLNRIELANRQNEIVVLLVDPWSARLHPYREILAEADRRGLGSAAVLVPVDRADDETNRHADELGFGVRQMFRHSSDRATGLFRSRIETPEIFAADLTKVLERARNRVFVEGHVYHGPSDGPPGDRPILRGP
jgi:FxsC-like protein